VQLQLDDLGTDYFQRRSQMIEAVTLDDARRVAKRLLDNGLLETVVGRPAGVASATGGAGDAPSRAPLAVGGPVGMSGDLR
jgi:zinc protease